MSTRTCRVRRPLTWAVSLKLDLTSCLPGFIDRWWDFGADTIINTNKAVRLTQDQPSEMGWLWSRLPLTSTNYQVEFEFKVRPALDLAYWPFRSTLTAVLALRSTARRRSSLATALECGSQKSVRSRTSF